MLTIDYTTLYYFIYLLFFFSCLHATPLFSSLLSPAFIAGHFDASPMPCRCHRRCFIFLFDTLMMSITPVSPPPSI